MGIWWGGFFGGARNFFLYPEGGTGLVSAVEVRGTKYSLQTNKKNQTKHGGW